MFSVIVASLLVGGMLAGGVAIAQGSDKQVSHLCLNKKNKVKTAGDETLSCNKKLTRAVVTAEKGSRGESGADGADGARGARGTTGSDGADGSKGAKGNKGSKGDTGPAGNKGNKGSKGDTGTAGPKGNTGASGGPASYYTVEATVRSDGKAQITASAFCDTGDLATGGGFRKNSFGTIEILYSFPSGSNGWQAQAQVT
ncbi:MAG: hypothetical protein V3V01_09760, partial [Acidimicrobiales bacterium]